MKLRRKFVLTPALRQVASLISEFDRLKIDNAALIEASSPTQHSRAVKIAHRDFALKHRLQGWIYSEVINQNLGFHEVD